MFKKLKFLIIVFILVVVIFSGYYVPKKYYSELEAQRISASKEAFKLNDEINKEKQLEEENNELSTYIEMANSTKNGEKNSFRNLTKIDGYMPEDVSAEKINFDDKMITLKCSCKNAASISEFVANLLESGLFKNVKVTDITQDDGDNLFDFIVYILQ